jgi:hypothetical protein
MASLDKMGEELMEKSWAPRTLQTIEVGLKSFHNLLEECDVANASERAASPAEVIRFIAYLSIQKKAPARINTYVSVVSTWHKMHVFIDPCDDFKVKRALKGVARAGKTPDGRAPVTLLLLKKLINAME